MSWIRCVNHMQLAVFFGRYTIFFLKCPEKLVYDNEFPVSTKKNKKYHGFGLRSIQHFVKKYDGVLNISEEDGCFSLKIMIPIRRNLD